MVVHMLRTSIPESANEYRPVARRLFFGILGIPNTQGVHGNSSLSTKPPPELAEEFGQHWGKFEEALHEMLNDPYTPTLFRSLKRTQLLYVADHIPCQSCRTEEST